MADTVNITGVTGSEPTFDLKITNPTQLQSVIFTQDPENPANLLATLPGGETQSFPDYLVLTQAGVPPELTLIDGSTVAGEEIIALVDEINYDLLAPAAGPTGPNAAGGGAGFTPYGTGALGDLLMHGPYNPDPGDLPDFGAKADEVGLNTDGSFELDVITGFQVSGYEDGQPGQYLGDYEESAMKVEVSMSPNNQATYRVSLTLSDLPEGSVLYVEGSPVSITGGAYTINLLGYTDEAQQAILDSIYLIGPEDSDVDFLLTAEAVFGGPTGELAVPADTTVIIDAVADMPVIPETIPEEDVSDQPEFEGGRFLLDDTLPPTNVPESGSDEPELSTFDVSIAAIFDDVADGSEHHMLFARVPDGFMAVEGSDGYQGTFEVTGESFIYLGESYPKTMAGLTDLLIEAGFETTDLSGLLAADSSSADDQLIDLAIGESYGMFYLSAGDMVSNGDSPTSPSYTANVSLTLVAPDRWDMEEEGEGWQVIGEDIGFIPEDTDGDGEIDSGVMVGDSGVLEFNIPTYALAMDIPSETGTELTYENNLSLVEAGTVEVTVDPVHGQLYVDDSAGFEDGDSGDMIGVEADRQDADERVEGGYVGYENDTGVPEGLIALNVRFAVPDNEQLISLEITGVRADAAVIAVSDNVLITDNGGGSWTLTAAGDTLTQDDLDGLALELNALSEVETDDDSDMDLSVAAIFVDPDTGHSLVRGGEIDVTVDAVAEEALILPPAGEEAPYYNYPEDNSDGEVDAEPIYGIGFTANVTDFDASGDDQYGRNWGYGSESITKIKINPKGEDDHFFSAPGDDAPVPTATVSAPTGDPNAMMVLYDGNSVSEGETLLVRGLFFEAGELKYGRIEATAHFNNSGTLVLRFDPADQVQRVDLSNNIEPQPSIALADVIEEQLPPPTGEGLEVMLPLHADDDVTFKVKVWTTENPTDDEVTLDNNVAISKALLDLEVLAVADGADIDASQQQTLHYEDGSSRVRDQGDEGEPGLYVGLDVDVQRVDQDGSEAVSKIVIALEGADAAARFVAATGELESEIILSGVRYSVLENGHQLTLELVDDPANIELALGTDIDIDNAIRVELPVDDSSDFSTRFTVTTGELGAEGDVLAGYMYHTSSQVIDHEVLGVVGKAATELDGERYVENEIVRGLDAYDAESNTLSFYEDGIASSEGHGDEEAGLIIPVLYRADTQDDDGSEQSEGIRRIDFDMGESDGTWQILYQDYADYTSGLTANGKGWYDLISGDYISGEGEVQIRMEGNELQVRFLNTDDVESIDLSGEIGIHLPIDDSTDFTLTVATKTKEFDDDPDGATGKETTWKSDTLNIEVKGVVAEALLGETGEEEPRGDFEVLTTSPSYGFGNISTYQEDDGNSNGLEDGGLRIGVPFNTRTQDDDGSEGIARIVLSLNEGAEGSFHVTPGDDGLIGGHQATWRYLDENHDGRYEAVVFEFGSGHGAPGTIIPENEQDYIQLNGGDKVQMLARGTFDQSVAGLESATLTGLVLGDGTTHPRHNDSFGVELEAGETLILSDYVDLHASIYRIAGGEAVEEMASTEAGTLMDGALQFTVDTAGSYAVRVWSSDGVAADHTPYDLDLFIAEAGLEGIPWLNSVTEVNLGGHVEVLIGDDDSSDFTLNANVQTVEYDDNAGAVHERTTWASDSQEVTLAGVVAKPAVDVADEELEEDGGSEGPLYVDLKGDIVSLDMDGSEDVYGFGISIPELPVGTVVMYRDPTGQMQPLTPGNIFTVTGADYGPNGTIDWSNTSDISVQFYGMRGGIAQFGSPTQGDSLAADAIRINGAILLQMPQDYYGTFTVNVGGRTVEYDDDGDMKEVSDLAYDSYDIEVDANPDLTGESSGGVDESDMAPPVIASGNIQVEFGDDIPGTVNGNGNFSASTTLASGEQAVTVTMDASGNWIGTIDGGATNVFTLAFDATGTGWSFTLNEPLNHPDATDPDDEIALNFGFTAADSDPSPDSVDGALSIIVNDDAPYVLPALLGAHFDFENPEGPGSGGWGTYTAYNDWSAEKGYIEIQNGAVKVGTDGPRIIELDAHHGSTTNAVVTTVIDTSAEGYNSLAIDLDYSPRAKGGTDTGDTSAFKIYLIDAAADETAWEPDGVGGWQPTAGTTVYAEYLNLGSDTTSWQTLGFTAGVPDGVGEMKLALVGAGIDDSYGALLDGINVNMANVIAEDPSAPLHIDVLSMVDIGADGFGSLMLIDPSGARVESLTLPDIGEAIVTINDEGRAVIAFMPALNYNGSLTLNYEVTDFDGDPAVGQTEVMVTPVNDPPVADDVLTLAEHVEGDGEWRDLAPQEAPPGGEQPPLPEGTLYYKVFDVDNWVDDGLFEASSLGGMDIEDPLHALTFNVRVLPEEGTLYRYNSTDGLVELLAGDSFTSTDDVMWTLNESEVRYVEVGVEGAPGSWGEILFSTKKASYDVVYNDQGVGIDDNKEGNGRAADWSATGSEKNADGKPLWKQVDDGVEKLYIDIPDASAASVSFKWLATGEEVNISFHYEHGSSNTITLNGAPGEDTQSFTAPDGKTLVGIQVWSGTNSSEFIVSKVTYTPEEGVMDLPESASFTYDVTDTEGATSKPATAEIIVEADSEWSDGNDYLIGDDGDNDLSGHRGNDYLVGGAGEDELGGGKGDDLLVGGEDDDTLTGGRGDDTLMGGQGDDHLYGEEGADTFLYKAGQMGHDTIHDFMPGQGDTIDLDALYDSLGIGDGSRVVEAIESNSGSTVLKVGTYDVSGGFADATGGAFSVTLDGVDLDDVDLVDMIGPNHIITGDES
ncbi:MAG: type I secretion C-terminal target domain-containing protein [Sedimenticola sp.]